MGQHILAYFDALTAVTGAKQTPVPDPIWAIQNGSFLPQKDWWLLGAYAMGTTLIASRIATPTFRQQTNPYLRPLVAAVSPDAYTHPVDYRKYPLKLKALEEIEVDSSTSGAGPADTTVLLIVSDGPIKPTPVGDLFTLHGVSTNNAAANAWSLLAVLWDDVLPQGVYAACGIEAISATGQASRLIFEDQVSRPGGISSALFTGNNRQMTTKGGLGDLGHFTGNRMPNIEVLCDAADAAHDIYLDYVKIA